MPKANSKSEDQKPTSGMTVEDNTDTPEARVEVEYVAVHEDLGGGVILTTYMEPVGGFPGDKAASE